MQFFVSSLTSFKEGVCPPPSKLSGKYCEIHLQFQYEIQSCHPAPLILCYFMTAIQIVKLSVKQKIAMDLQYKM